jgi:hypothetical protein
MCAYLRKEGKFRIASQSSGQEEIDEMFVDRRTLKEFAKKCDIYAY